MIKKVFLIILAILFVTNFVVLALLWNGANTVLDSSTYKSFLEKSSITSEVQEQLSATVAKQLAEQMGGAVSEAELKEKLKEVFSEEWMKTEANNLVTELLAYLKGEKEELELNVSIVEVKQKLSDLLGEIAKEKARQSGLPAEMVNSEQIKQLLASQIPDTISLKEMIVSSSPDALSQLEEAKKMIQLFFTALNGLIVTAIVLLIFIVLLSFRTLKGLIGWIGGTLLASGILALLTAGLIGGMGAVLPASLPNEIPAQAKEAIIELLTGIIGKISNGIILQAGIVAIIGIILLIIWFALPKESQQKKTFAKAK